MPSLSLNFRVFLYFFFRCEQRPPLFRLFSWYLIFVSVFRVSKDYWISHKNKLRPIFIYLRSQAIQTYLFLTKKKKGVVGTLRGNVSVTMQILK